MTIPFWCVLIAGLMPIGAAGLAKIGGRSFDNANPRGWLAQQTGFRARANAAQLNSFEAFPLFAAAVIVAHLRGAPVATVSALAVAYLVARAVYVGLYLADLDKLRSLAWFVALVLACTIFVI
jgi:uncharacterized MAPEG superfamily protein